jgi:hypothetical protein
MILLAVETTLAKYEDAPISISIFIISFYQKEPTSYTKCKEKKVRRIKLVILIDSFNFVLFATPAL